MPGVPESTQLAPQGSSESLRELEPTSAEPPVRQVDTTSFADADCRASLIERLSLGYGGEAEDPRCAWLSRSYDGSDPGHRLLLLSVLPMLCKTYLLRLADHPTDPVAGFEAVLITVYNSRVRRSSRPATTVDSSTTNTQSVQPSRPRSSPAEQLFPLDPTQGIPSLQRAAVVGTALGAVVSNLSALPADTRSELCMLAETIAFHGCPWASEGLNLPTPIPDLYKPTARHPPTEEELGLALAAGTSVIESEGVAAHFVVGAGPPKAAAELALKDSDGASTSASAASRPPGSDVAPDGRRFSRIPLSNELLRPLTQGLAYCLLNVRPRAEESHQLAVSASRGLYARVLHDARPEHILAARTLLRLHALRV